MPTNEFHRRVLDVIDVLTVMDPPADSPEGRLLRVLAAATESYERERQFIEELRETPPFRAEQEKP